MPECLVNATPQTFDFRPKTWGDMLDALDRLLQRDRQVVTAVRFDGVDEPSFRAGAAAGRDLGAVGRVDVEAVATAVLLRDALDAALDSLPALVHAARLAASAFRAEQPDAHAQLSALITAMQSLVALTAAAATATRVSLGAAAQEPAPAQAVADACAEVDTALRTLADRQSDRDWPGVAAALDAVLAPSIARWGDVLGSLRERAAA